MSAFHPLPTREAILANGIPAGLIAYQQQQARVARARALGAFLAAVLRGLVPRRLPPAGNGLAPT